MSTPTTASSPPRPASAGITIRDLPTGLRLAELHHDGPAEACAQRKTVSPMFTPAASDELAVLIRQRSGKVLDELPRNETFNFVDRVSIETDDADAGDAVRFSYRGTSQLMRCPMCDDRTGRRAACGNRWNNASRRWRMPVYFAISGTNASIAPAQ